MLENKGTPSSLGIVITHRSKLLLLSRKMDVDLQFSFLGHKEAEEHDHFVGQGLQVQKSIGPGK